VGCPEVRHYATWTFWPQHLAYHTAETPIAAGRWLLPHQLSQLSIVYPQIAGHEKDNQGASSTYRSSSGLFTAVWSLASRVQACLYLSSLCLFPVNLCKLCETFTNHEPGI
jgi:hypothetical protein